MNILGSITITIYYPIKLSRSSDHYDNRILVKLKGKRQLNFDFFKVSELLQSSFVNAITKISSQVENG